MVNKQAILENSKLGADAYARPAPRPAALPPEDAPMSPHLDLGSWREWDRGLRHYRVAASSKKSLLWIGAPLLAVLILLHFYLSFWIYSSGIGVIMPAFFLWYLIDHALTARRRLSPRDNFFDKVIARGGLVCPQCEVPLEAASAPDRWSCSQCASSYTGQQLTRLIDGKFAKFRAADASPVWSWICRKLGLHAATDRIALAFCSVKFAIIGLTFYLLLASLFGLIEAEIIDRNVSVFAFLPPAFIIIGTVLIIGGIRLRREPYSRCAHCFYTVPEGIALPERCSECGCSWHAPGGLLHHRIEWRPMGYGGLVFSLLALLLLGNGMYRDWQLGQALQTPTTATTSMLMGALRQDTGYWGDDVKALQAELHSRSLSPGEVEALADLYLSRIEAYIKSSEDTFHFSGSKEKTETAWLLSLLDADEIADRSVIENRLIRTSVHLLSTRNHDDWELDVNPPPVISIGRIAELPIQVIAAQVVINGEEKECSVGPWRWDQTAYVDVNYRPQSQDNQVEVTVWCAAPDVKIENKGHRDPAYLSKHPLPGVWSVTTAFQRVADEVPQIAVGDAVCKTFHEENVSNSSLKDVVVRFTIDWPRLAAQQVREMDKAKSALGDLVKDPVFQMKPVTRLRGGRWDEVSIEIVSSTGSQELDQLVLQYLRSAEIDYNEWALRFNVKIDLDSLHPAVAEVTP